MLAGSAFYRSTLNFNIPAAFAFHESGEPTGARHSTESPTAPGAQKRAGEGGQAPPPVPVDRSAPCTVLHTDTKRPQVMSKGSAQPPPMALV